MSIENILSASAAKSYKTDPAGVVSGVVEGIAFRARIPEGQLEMSVNLPEANLAKLQNKLGGRYPGNTVAYQNFGIVVTLPDMAGMSGEDFTAFLEIAAKDAGKLIGVSYDDKFEKDREPFLSYLRGIAGALLGAVIGVLPWFLCSYFLNWGLWFLGFLVSTVLRLPPILWYAQHHFRHNLYCMQHHIGRYAFSNRGTDPFAGILYAQFCFSGFLDCLSAAGRLEGSDRRFALGTAGRRRRFGGYC